MKVLFVVNALGEGGTEKSLADLLPGLRDAGLDIRIVTLRSRGAEGVEPALRDMGFDIQTIGDVGRFGRVRAIRRVIRRFQPDVVHTMLFEANLNGRIAALGTGSRVVVSLVSTTYSEARLADPRLDRRKQRVVQAVDAALARLATDHFHAVSEAVRNDARRGLRIPDDKITVIRRGRRAETLPVTTPERRQTSRARLGLSPESRVLVSVGRQEFAKGHRFLLHAVEQLDDVPNLVVLVVGREGNESDELQRLIEAAPRSLAARVRFLGHRSDVADILAAADLFVFPSLYEGMPGAVIEAMAAGIPIVASDIEPVLEATHGVACTRLVPPSNPHALAQAIRELLDDPDRLRAMGVAGRRAFEERYTMSASEEAMVALYERMTSQPHPG